MKIIQQALLCAVQHLYVCSHFHWLKIKLMLTLAKILVIAYSSLFCVL